MNLQAAFKKAAIKCSSNIKEKRNKKKKKKKEKTWGMKQISISDFQEANIKCKGVGWKRLKISFLKMPWQSLPSSIGGAGWHICRWIREKKEEKVLRKSFPNTPATEPSASLAPAGSTGAPASRQVLPRHTGTQQRHPWSSAGDISVRVYKSQCMNKQLNCTRNCGRRVRITPSA